jgi:hypothetical protein
MNDSRIGSAHKKPVQVNKATYCYGGISRAVESADEVPIEISMPSNQYRAKEYVMQQDIYNRNWRPQSGSTLARSKVLGNTKTCYPKAYYKHVGYQRSETSSQVQRDALGQRVRERFNEASDFKSIPQPQKAALKLNNKNLKKEDKSITTPSQLSSAFRKLGAKPSASVATKKELSRKQPSRASRTIFSGKSHHKSLVSLSKPVEEPAADETVIGRVDDDMPYATIPAPEPEQKDLYEEPAQE